MVGQNLAEDLTRQGYGVTIIDLKSLALERASEDLDVQTVLGHGADTDVLVRAGVVGAELFRWEVVLARPLSSTQHLVARVCQRQLEYRRPGRQVGRNALFPPTLCVDSAARQVSGGVIPARRLRLLSFRSGRCPLN